MPPCRLLGGCRCSEKHTGLEVQGGSDAVCSTEMLVSLYHIIQCYNPENHTMLTLCYENFKFYKLDTAASQEIIENTVEKVWLQGMKVVLGI